MPGHWPSGTVMELFGAGGVKVCHLARGERSIREINLLHLVFFLFNSLAFPEAKSKNISF